MAIFIEDGQAPELRSKLEDQFQFKLDGPRRSQRIHPRTEPQAQRVAIYSMEASGSGAIRRADTPVEN